MCTCKYMYINTCIQIDTTDTIPFLFARYITLIYTSAHFPLLLFSYPHHLELVHNKKKVLMIFVVMPPCSQGFIEIIDIKHLILCFPNKTALEDFNIVIIMASRSIH